MTYEERRKAYAWQFAYPSKVFWPQYDKCDGHGRDFCTGEGERHGPYGRLDLLKDLRDAEGDVAIEIAKAALDVFDQIRPNYTCAGCAYVLGQQAFLRGYRHGY